jgi:hypothetical protein
MILINMITKVVTGIALIATLSCVILYYKLESTNKDLLLKEREVAELTFMVEGYVEEAKRAENVRRKHDEIIAELFSAQDATKEEYDDLLTEFKGLKPKSCSCKSVPRKETLSEVVIDTKDSSDSVDFSAHKRVLDKAACSAGNSASCTSPTSAK